MIELDDTNVEYVRCTCLDRARIALQNSGQHTCAGQMLELQKEFDAAGKEFEMDPSKPLDIMDYLRVLSIIARSFMKVEDDEAQRQNSAS